MSRGNVIIQNRRETILIELGDVLLNLYIISSDYMENFIKEKDSVTNFYKKLRKIKCPNDLQETKVVLEIENDWFYDHESEIKFKKCIPIQAIREKAKFHFSPNDKYHEVEPSKDNIEKRLTSLLSMLDQKKLIEDIILEITKLGNQQDFMEFYVKNSRWISIDDFLDLYYTFKIKK